MVRQLLRTEMNSIISSTGARQPRELDPLVNLNNFSPPGRPYELDNATGSIEYPPQLS
jgi:hypothetical protein